MCRSRRELSNAYLLAKFRFDTAENEPCKVCRIPLIQADGRAAEGGGSQRAPRKRSAGAMAWRSAQSARKISRLHGRVGALRLLRTLGSAGCSAGLYRARSRLYRSQILQENMRLKALAEIYTMHSFAQLCNLNFLSKICQHFSKFCKIQPNFANKYAFESSRRDLHDSLLCTALKAYFF